MGKGDRLGEFEQAVLLAVARLEDEAYGVAVRREIEHRAGRDVSIGAVYSTLERLQDKEMVSSSVGEPTPERGGRAKRYYRLEPEGARALEAARRAMARLWEGVDLEAYLESGR